MDTDKPRAQDYLPARFVGFKGHGPGCHRLMRLTYAANRIKAAFIRHRTRTSSAARHGREREAVIPRVAELQKKLKAMRSRRDKSNLYGHFRAWRELRREINRAQIRSKSYIRLRTLHIRFSE